MNTRDIRDLVLKVIGFYCAVRFVYALSQSAVSCMSILGESRSVVESMSRIASRPLFVVLMFLPPVLYLLLACFLLFRTSGVVALLWPQQHHAELPDNESRAPAMSFWISLIGIYFFIHSAGGLVSQLWILATRREMFGSGFISIRQIPDLVTFPISILAIVKAEAIERLVTTLQQRRAPNKTNA